MTAVTVVKDVRIVVSVVAVVAAVLKAAAEVVVKDAVDAALEWINQQELEAVELSKEQVWEQLKERLREYREEAVTSIHTTRMDRLAK